MKDRNLIEAIEVDLTAQKLSLSEVENIVEELTDLGISIYVSGISTEVDEKELHPFFISLYSNIHVKGISFSVPSQLLGSSDRTSEFFSWLDLNYLNKDTSDGKLVPVSND
jgi:hypothetical protein